MTSSHIAVWAQRQTLGFPWWQTCHARWKETSRRSWWRRSRRGKKTSRGRLTTGQAPCFVAWSIRCSFRLDGARRNRLCHICEYHRNIEQVMQISTYWYRTKTRRKLTGFFKCSIKDYSTIENIRDTGIKWVCSACLRVHVSCIAVSALVVVLAELIENTLGASFRSMTTHAIFTFSFKKAASLIT